MREIFSEGASKAAEYPVLSEQSEIAVITSRVTFIDPY